MLTLSGVNAGLGIACHQAGVSALNEGERAPLPFASLFDQETTLFDAVDVFLITGLFCALTSMTSLRRGR